MFFIETLPLLFASVQRVVNDLTHHWIAVKHADGTAPVFLSRFDVRQLVDDTLNDFLQPLQPLFHRALAHHLLLKIIVQLRSTHIDTLYHMPGRFGRSEPPDLLRLPVFC